MAITTYSELQTAIGSWLNRADLTTQIPDFIALAEGTLNKIVRDPRMVAATTIALTTPWRRGAVPTDLLAPVYLQIQATATSPLEQISPEQLVMLRRRMSSAGTPKFYCVIGRFIEVCPSPSSNTTLDIDYYQAIPALASNSTNWLLTYNPDIYLYTALLHASPFLQDDARTELFKNLLVQDIAALIKANESATLDTMRQAGFSLNSPSDPPRSAA